MMKNLAQLAWLKIRTIHYGVSDCDHAEIDRGQLITAISGHGSEASLRNYIVRP